MINEEVMRLQREVGSAVIEYMAEYDWQSINLHYAWVGRSGELKCFYIDWSAKLRYPGFEADDGVVLDVLRELKKACADEHGTWLSATVTIDRASGEYNVAYNYDQEPEWDIQATPESYLLELHMYPRPESEIPDWYPKEADYPNWREAFA